MEYRGCCSPDNNRTIQRVEYWDRSNYTYKVSTHILLLFNRSKGHNNSKGYGSGCTTARSRIQRFFTAYCLTLPSSLCSNNTQNLRSTVDWIPRQCPDPRSKVNMLATHQTLSFILANTPINDTIYTRTLLMINIHVIALSSSTFTNARKLKLTFINMIVMCNPSALQLILLVRSSARVNSISNIHLN